MRSLTSKSLLWLLFLIYLAILFKLVFFKVRIGSVGYHYSTIADRLTLRHNFILANFTPFKTIINLVNSKESLAFIVQNIAGNIIVFVPFGFLLPFLFVHINKVGTVIFWGFLLSFCIEIIQLFGILGSFDVDDILLNTIGTTIGYLLYKLFGNMMPQKQRSSHCKIENV